MKWSVAGVVLGLVVATTGGVSSASVGPEVSVQGASDLDVDVRTAGTSLQVEGRLTDDIGDPLPEQRIDISVRDAATSFDEDLYTDFYGRFSMATELSPGSYDVEIDFAGASHLSGTRRSETIDVETAPVRVGLETPGWVHGADEEVPIEVAARSDGEGLATFVWLEVDGESIASFELGADGRGRFDAGPFLEVGDNELIVGVPETDYRERAAATARIRRVDEPTVDGEVERVFRRTERGHRVGLTVEDDQGPVAGATADVRLTEATGDEERRLVERIATGDDGRGTAMFADDDIDDGTWSVTAAVQPDVGEPILWRGGEIEYYPPLWLRLLRLAGMVILAAGGLWLGRHALVTLRTIVVRIFERREDDDSESVGDKPVLEAVEEVDLEVVESGDVAELTGPQTVVLRLRDEWRDEAVDEAVVEVEGPDGTTEEFDVTDGDDLVLCDRRTGPSTIEVRAPGFVPAFATLEVPIDARLVRLEMTPVPIKIRRAYRWMLERTQGEDVWGRLTPREVERAMRRIEPVDDSVELRDWRDVLEREWSASDEEERIDLLVRTVTAVVEETNFSGRDFEVEVWESTRRVMSALVDSIEAGSKDENHR